MPAGRPPTGSGHVMALDGGADDKHRLRVILDVMAGALSVRQACVVLGVSEARFHQLRSQALQGALDAMAPRPAGRPTTHQPQEDSVEALQQQVKHLQVELHTALIRTELALAMPQVLMDRDSARSKKKSRRQSN